MNNGNPTLTKLEPKPMDPLEQAIAERLKTIAELDMREANAKEQYAKGWCGMVQNAAMVMLRQYDYKTPRADGEVNAELQSISQHAVVFIDTLRQVVLPYAEHCKQNCPVIGNDMAELKEKLLSEVETMTAQRGGKMTKDGTIVPMGETEPMTGETK